MQTPVFCVYAFRNKSFQKEEEALLEAQFPTGKREDSTAWRQGVEEWGCRSHGVCGSMGRLLGGWPPQEPQERGCSTWGGSSGRGGMVRIKRRDGRPFRRILIEGGGPGEPVTGQALSPGPTHRQQQREPEEDLSKNKEIFPSPAGCRDSLLPSALTSGTR